MSYWFKRKRFGYGWVPSSKEGWFLTLSYLFIILLVSIYPFGSRAQQLEWAGVFIYLLVVFGMTAIFLRLVIQHSPSGKWRWGWKEGDDPTIDW